MSEQWPGAPVSSSGGDWPGTPRAPVSTGEALKEGYLSGASANFRDEIKAQSDASGLPEWMGGFRAVVGGPKLAYEALTGQPGEATKTYNESLSAIREHQKAAHEQHPIASTIGEVGGSLLLPAGAAARGGTMAARAIRGAAVGAGYGGLAGVGAGEDNASRLTQGAQGAALGGAIGAAGVPVVEGLVQGGKAVLGPVVNAVRGAINPEAEAARRVAATIERDTNVSGGAPGLTPQEFRTTPDARVVDLGGEATRALARSAANTSPEGRQVLNSAINERFEGQTGRVTDWMRGAFNYPNANAQKTAIEQTGKSVNTPAYARAMHDGSNGVWDAELQRLAGAPAIQEAARGAIPSLGNRGITEGFAAPRQNPLSVNPQTGTAELSTLPNGSQRVPDLRFWDQVKRNLDGMIGKAQNNGDNAKVQELTGVKNELVGNLDRLVPFYAQARAGAAHFFGAENALEAGQKFVTENFNSSGTRQALAKMSPTERQLFQDGFVSRYIETLNMSGDRRNVLNKIADSPAAREKLQLALGPQKAAELETRLRVEGVMDLARPAVQGNSTTARQIAELTIAGGSGFSAIGGSTVGQDPRATAGELITAAFLAGKHGINVRVARRVADMLVSKDASVLGNGIKVVANSGKFLDALRSTDRRLAAVGGEQSARVPVPYSPDVVRAEEVQNNRNQQ